MADLNLVPHSAGDDSHPLEWARMAFALSQELNRETPMRQHGARLDALRLLSSREGAGLPRLFGRMRLGGQLIWHGDVVETIYQSGGDKSDGDRTPIERSYGYNMSLAIALCEGTVARIGRIWADGKLLDAGRHSHRFYRGTSDQMPDPTIEAVMGRGNACAYRNTAYVVFPDFHISDFGNRIPQFTFEVFGQNDSLTHLVRAVDILPGSTEFGYDPELFIRYYADASSDVENFHAEQTRSDWTVSMDDLQQSCPNCKWVALVVSWFGNDLRAGSCRLEPRVEDSNKQTLPETWSVLGRDRSRTTRVSYLDERPLFGSTPNDASVKRAIADLKARGLKIMFYPFIMMDIPSGNNLPSPYGGTQPPIPWRGRITCTPAKGQANSVDGSAAAAAQIARFVNGHNSRDPYCLRGMVEHYARLCAEAGGVDAFILASEMRGLSRVRDAAGDYPFAGHLKTLAGRVRAKLPNCKISYAADWSEYNAYAHGEGNVDFPLDAFWSDSNCDFIGIDAYFPLSDWRDGAAHLDAAQYGSIYNLDYLKSQVEGGEYYDYYYADRAARDAQRRIPISDGLGEPWLYRQKDIRNWWGNRHVRRVAGVKGAATGWVPKSKPIWFTELGCAAVDKGSNQPNIFPDTKSVEGGVPFYSSGVRDDHIQRQFLRAVTEYYDVAANNPRSQIYNAPMLSTDHIFIWAWDARPFPIFPYRTDIWSDGDNWHSGHWLNGRLSGLPIADIVDQVSHAAVDTRALSAVSEGVEGYVVSEPSSSRAALEPFRIGFALDFIVNDGIAVRDRVTPHQRVIHVDDMVHAGARSAPLLVRQSRRELPHVLRLSYIAADDEYQPQLAEARYSNALAPIENIDLPFVLSSEQAQAIADRLLHEAWLESDLMQFSLSLAHSDLEPGDVLSVAGEAWRITALTFSHIVEVEARRHAPVLYTPRVIDARRQSKITTTEIVARPDMQVVELPADLMEEHATPSDAPILALTAEPWPQSVRVERSDSRAHRLVRRAAVMGALARPLAAGPIGRWDMTNQPIVQLVSGELESRSEAQILNGANRLAIAHADGWEVMQFVSAELIAPKRYRLSQLLRGVGGSDDVVQGATPQDAACILLHDNMPLLPGNFAAVDDAVTLSYGPPQAPRDSYAWQRATYPIRKQARKPLSPVHLQVTDAAGGLRFDWVRRTRIGGDDFAAVEVPLGEARESYEVIIRRDSKNSAPLRRVTISTRHWLYTSAAQTADRLASNTDYLMEVRQMSQTHGAGAARAVRFRRASS